MKDARLIELFNLVPPTGKFKSPQRGRVFSPMGISPALDTFGGGNREPKIVQLPHGYNKGGTFSECPTITTSSWQDNNFVMNDKQTISLPAELRGKKIRIRKLTPRECFRLMDVDDADIDKIQATGLSNSAQYRLAGNSIVVNVLFHIFRKMFTETGEEVEAGTQLELF